MDLVMASKPNVHILRQQKYHVEISCQQFTCSVINLDLCYAFIIDGKKINQNINGLQKFYIRVYHNNLTLVFFRDNLWKFTIFFQFIFAIHYFSHLLLLLDT
jgi:hypothetical protein